MKNLGKLFIMGAMVLALASCGKENKSGGSEPAAPAAVANPTTGNASGINYKTYAEIKKAYTTKDFNIGTTNNMVIYHIGPDYGGQSFGNSNIDLNFDFGFCINFFGHMSGDCEQNNNQSDQYAEVLSRGEYKVVNSSTKDVVKLDVATEVSGNGFIFTEKTFDRQDEFYKAMLNLDGKSVKIVVVKQAEVTLTDGKALKADYVEYFYSDGSVEGFVLSNELPLIANPIASTKEHDLVGALSFSGSKTIGKITVNIHEVDHDLQTNTYVPRNIGSRTITF